MKHSNKNVAIFIVILAIAGTVAYLFFNTDNRRQDSTVIVTPDDNGETVTLDRGQRLLVKLGDLQWNISLSDPTIISRVKNVMVVRGAQGLYTADKQGTTTLSAEGRPSCSPGDMCAQYIVEFNTTIVVR